MTEENSCLDSEEMKEVCDAPETAMPDLDTVDEPCDMPDANE